MLESRPLKNPFINIQPKNNHEIKHAPQDFYTSLFKNLHDKNPHSMDSIKMEPAEAIGILNCAFRYPNLCAELSKKLFIGNKVHPNLNGVNLFILYFKRAFSDLLENNINKTGEAKPSWEAYFSENPEQLIFMNSWLEPFLNQLNDPAKSKLLPPIKNLKDNLTDILHKRLDSKFDKDKKRKPDMLAYIYESVGDPISLQVTKFKMTLDKYLEITPDLGSRLAARGLREFISSTFDASPNQNGLNQILDRLITLFYTEKMDPVLLHMLYQSSLLHVAKIPEKKHHEILKEFKLEEIPELKKKAAELFDSWHSIRKNPSVFDKEVNNIERDPKINVHEKIVFYLNKYNLTNENKLTSEEKVKCFNGFVSPLFSRDLQNTQVKDEALLKKSLELFTKLDDKTKWNLARALFQYSTFKAGMSDMPQVEFKGVNLNRLQAFRIATELNLNISPDFIETNTGKNVDSAIAKTKMLDKLQTINELDNYNWFAFIDKIEMLANPLQNEKKPLPNKLNTSLTNFIEQFENATGEARFLKRDELINELLLDLKNLKSDKQNNDIGKFMSSKEGKTLSEVLEKIRAKASTEKNYDGKADFDIIKIYRDGIKSESSKFDSFNLSQENAMQADQKGLKNRP